MATKLPAFQFYPGDWQKDPCLRRCSFAAKGVWMDMICLMFECDERGVLMTNGAAWSDEEIARALGGDQVATLSHIAELLRTGVAKRRTDGAIFSARLVRDEQKRRKCSEAGKLGGNPQLNATLKGQSKGVDKGDLKGVSKRHPTPSSSSSTSSSPSGSNTPQRPPDGGKEKPVFDPRTIPIPESLATPEFLQAWGEWIDFRQGMKSKRLQPKSWEAQLTNLVEFGPEVSSQAIKNSIAAGYQGLFPESVQARQKANPQQQGLKFDGLRQFMEGGSDDA